MTAENEELRAKLERMTAYILDAIAELAAAGVETGPTQGRLGRAVLLLQRAERIGRDQR